MRVLEALVTLFHLCMCICLVIRQTWFFSPNWWFALYVGLICLQVANEGPRWQMFLNYCCTVILIAVTLVFMSEPRVSVVNICRFFGVIGVIFALVSGILCYFMPVLVLPPLSGKYFVGTVTLHWVDKSRPQWTDPAATDHRELMVQVWYPCDDKQLTERKFAPYYENLSILGPALLRSFGLPAFLLNHFSLVSSRSFYACPPLRHKVSHNTSGGIGGSNGINLKTNQRKNKNSKFKVLLFSHGYTGTRNQNVVLCEELASHGFIVVAPEHAHDSSMTILSDGRKIPFSAAAPPGISSDGLWELRNRQLAVRAADISFCLDCLEEINEGKYTCGFVSTNNLQNLNQAQTNVVPENRVNMEHFFKGLLDLDRVGVFGHSFGGATSISACQNDRRLKACVGLDAWMWPLPKELTRLDQVSTTSGDSFPSDRKLQQAVLLIQAPRFFQEKEAFSKFNTRLARVVLNNGINPYKLFVKVHNSHHHDYCDLPLFAPTLTKWLKLSGSIDTWKCQRILFDFTYNFFKISMSTVGQTNSLLQTQRKLSQKYTGDVEVQHFQIANSSIENPT